MPPTKNSPITEKTIELIAAHYEISADELKNGTVGNKIRRIATYILKEGFGEKIKAIMVALAIKGSQTVYIDCKSVAAELKTNTALATVIEDIKTEVLTMSVSHQNPPAPEKTSATSSEKSPTPSGNHSDIKTIDAVKHSVSEICLGASLLKSSDPSLDVRVAKEFAMYLLCEDFPKIGLRAILDGFEIDEGAFHAAIGKLLFQTKQKNADVLQKLNEIRKSYPTRLNK